MTACRHHCFSDVLCQLSIKPGRDDTKFGRGIEAACRKWFGGRNTATLSRECSEHQWWALSEQRSEDGRFIVNVLVPGAAPFLCLQALSLAGRRRHRKATSGLVAALTTLGNGDAHQIIEQRLGEETDLRMAGKCRREGAARS